jgi:hypothetical protein
LEESKHGFKQRQKQGKQNEDETKKFVYPNSEDGRRVRESEY